MTMIKAVIFDLDGCLVDSEPLILEAIAIEMRALGIRDASAREIGDQFLGIAMPVIVEYVSERLGRRVPEDFAARVENHVLTTYQTELKLVPGTEKLIAGLKKRGTAIAIATGGSLKRMKSTLELAGIADDFKGNTSSAEEVKNGKPAPDLFKLALDRLGLKPSECLVVEDSPHGIVGARAAGIAAIGFVGGSHLNEKKQQHAALLREADAIEVFDTLSGVEQFIHSYAGGAIK
ncbi:HAD family hydrolase [Grimontia sp. NTOU-MAR1]|uniref:HAD family hydrolase n=1 Tax=Grimontia sp. NTOU-MAR1 TaxID=3111011 RepID=UPI002DBC7167|nr:HAD family phosphatase [Grimontia sp. NTOU-MAR1]WRV99036.1 HAD family phosphatase [Grimontia sp. NTOU-MAR1]